MLKNIFVLFIFLTISSACADEMAVEQAGDAFDVHQGTASVWMYFEKGVARRDHLIFSTDDSRLCLFVDTYFSAGMGTDIVRIGARAIGNQQSPDSASGPSYPEASIIIDNTGALANYRHAWYSPAKFPEGEWHFVAMTWQGYPEGTVKIYFDGELKGQRLYNKNHDDGRPLFETYSVGYRPSEWKGALVRGGDLRPSTDMSLERGGIRIKGLEFRKECLSDAGIRGMMGAGPLKRYEENYLN